MAIIYDNTSTGTGNTSSLTVSHTTGSGSDRYLVVGIGLGDSSGRTVTGITYNGISMSQLVHFSGAAYASNHYIFGIVAPSSGVHDIVCSVSGTSVVTLVAISYAGVNSIGQPDSYAQLDNGSSPGPTTISTTTVKDNDWLVLFGVAYANVPTISTGTQRGQADGGASWNSIVGGDSNSAETPPGSYSLAYTYTGTSNAGAIISLSPTYSISVNDSITVSESTIIYDIAVGIKTYATWNPGDLWGGASLSGGNLTLTNTIDTLWASGRSTVSKSSGKWYWEYTLTSSTSFLMSAIANSAAANTNFLGADINGWGYYGPSGKKYNDGVSVAYGATYGTGTVIGVALDMDAGTVTMYKNNASQGVMYSGLTGEMFAGVSTYSLNSTCVANFGASAFTYTPPTGFNAGLYTTIPAINGSVTASSNTTSELSTTQSFTITAPPVDTILIAYMTNPQGSSTSSATWNGTTMTRTDLTSNFFTDVYYLINPEQGTHDLVYNFPSYTGAKAWTIFLAAGVRGISNISGAGGTSTNATHSITTAKAASLIIGFCASYASTHTQGAGQTELSNIAVSSLLNASSSQKDGVAAGSQTLNTTLGTNTTWQYTLLSLDSNALIISVSDSVSISENISINQAYSPDIVVDSVTVSEDIVVSITVFYINISDSITVSENIALPITILYFNIFDSVTVSENILVFIPTFSLNNVADSVTVTENTSLFVTVLYINIFDSITITEYITAFTLSQFNFVMVDSVTIAENIAISIIVLYLNIIDSVTVTEDTPIKETCSFNVIDSATVSESINIVLVSNGILTENIIITENITIIPVTNLSIIENIIIYESFISTTQIYGYNLPMNRPKGSISFFEGIADLTNGIYSAGGGL